MSSKKCPNLSNKSKHKISLKSAGTMWEDSKQPKKKSFKQSYYQSGILKSLISGSNPELDFFSMALQVLEKLYWENA